ncbi:MAG: Flp family type IVb pilin [Acidobacteriota bacterium]|nr:Flp family type IVb pilin [Acidobacteriota bacterium]
MQNATLKLYLIAKCAQNALGNDQGRDLLEYGLVVALIGFGAIATVGSLASGISAALSNIAVSLNSTSSTLSGGHQ